MTNIIDAFHPIHGALQHLWTLAEEEQFYLLWPIVLLWLLRRRVSPMRLARGLAVAVFALIVYRAGVLGLVAFALLSFVFYHPGVGDVSPWWDHTAVSILVVELAGAALVAGAIAPAGTAAVRLLSVAPLVWLGQISYSLYLWHPIVSTYAPNKIVVVPVALLFAWGSYKLIEQPFRKHRSSLSRAAETPTVGIDAAPA